MPTLITRAPADSPGLYLTPDGYIHASIAAAARHLQARTLVPTRPAPAKRPPRAVQRRRPTRTVPMVVAAPVVRPVPVQAPALPDPRAVLSDLCRQLRHAQAELDAVPGITGPTWSAAYRYHCALRARYSAPVARLKRQIADHRDRFGLPLLPFWKPRPAHAADRRIARQYKAENTPSAWPETKSAPATGPAVPSVPVAPVAPPAKPTTLAGWEKRFTAGLVRAGLHDVAVAVAAA